MALPDRHLITAAQLVEALATKVPRTRALLLDRVHAVDGWPSGSDEPKVAHSASSAPTEAAGAKRLVLAHRLNDLATAKANLVTAVTELSRLCDRVLGPELTVETPRCDGGAGREGAIEWGKPDCTNVPKSRRICDRCRWAEYQWRKEHGLISKAEAW
jgi:hypothetical protein